MHHPRILTLLLCGIGLTGPIAVVAQASAAEPETPAATGDQGVPKDPRGVKGISPLWEAVAAGDVALLAKDLDSALQRYEEAVKSEPKNPVGHYRLAEAQLAKGNLAEAQQSLEGVVRFGNQDAAIQAKALFLLADLAERQAKLSEARAAWKRYAEHVAAHSEVKSFAATASERVKRIAAREADLSKYAAVAERIKKGAGGSSAK